MHTKNHIPHQEGGGINTNNAEMHMHIDNKMSFSVHTAQYKAVKMHQYVRQCTCKAYVFCYVRGNCYFPRAQCYEKYKELSKQISLRGILQFIQEQIKHGTQ
jgi:hypothetical protein